MINIKDILVYVYKNVKAKNPRFKVEDDEHILDTKTGAEFHLYDDDGKITHGEKVIAKMAYFTKPEKEVLFEIKKLITDPALVAKKQAHYPVMVKEARAAFSNLFETPNPIMCLEPEEEPNTIPYAG